MRKTSKQPTILRVTAMAGNEYDDKQSKNQSFVSCSNKRRRRRAKIRSLTSMESSGQSNFSLNDLKELLIEVLQRLPTKSAFQCKCVCKDWYSLISSPYFASRFVTHHLNPDDDSNDTSYYCQNPSTFIINYFNIEHRREIFTVSDEPIFKSRGFELPRHTKVVAVFNDLMLCSNWSRYFIYNPFTMQRVALPSSNQITSDCVGFVCEPHYFKDAKGEYNICNGYRYRIVHFNEVDSDDVMNIHFTVERYCSETDQWCESVLDGPEFDMVTNVIAYKGKLHWYNGENIVAFDPFNIESSSFINGSVIRSTKPGCDNRPLRDFPGGHGYKMPHSDYYSIGVCQGFLRIMQLVCGVSINTGTSNTLTIWELKDYRRGEWNLEHRVYLDTMIPESSLVQIIRESGISKSKPLGFHPGDGDIVYLHFVGLVVLCNMRTRKLEMVGRIRSKGRYFPYDDVFSIVLPWWPTPIPSQV